MSLEISPLIKAFYISYLLLAAGYDIKTFECPDSIHIIILLIASIPQTTISFLLAIGKALAVYISFFFINIIFSPKIGGADYKLISVSTALLGLENTITGMLISLLLAALCEGLKGNRNNPFPLLPYLAQGFSLVLIR